MSRKAHTPLKTRKVVVLGAGPAGLATALALARDGHHVTLIERDALDVTAPHESVDWTRKGIPHFLQPHAFIARGRNELRDHFGDVLRSLLDAGAWDVDVSRKIPGERRPGDEDLQYLGVRRPVIEWALRKAVAAQSDIVCRLAGHAEGIRIEDERISAVALGGDWLPAEIVVDAMGRSSPMRGWLSSAGHEAPAQEASDCGVIYYTRYYRLRDGAKLSQGPWLFGPRGDLGYMGFASFPGDRGTLSALLAVPTGRPEFKVFRHEPIFEAAIAQIPLLRQWAAPERVEPITPVMPMGGLKNSLNGYDGATPCGLFPVGDALCHIDPVLAHGLSFSIVHGRELATALRDHDDTRDAFEAYSAAVSPELRERFDLATALDEQRHRMWTGGSVDFAHRAGDYALFTMTAAAAVAMTDRDVGRVFVRRIGLLDSTRVLDDDIAMQARIESAFAELMKQPRAPKDLPKKSCSRAVRRWRRCRRHESDHRRA